MRLDIALLAALAARVVADSLTILTACNMFGICRSFGKWHADNASYGNV